MEAKIRVRYLFVILFPINYLPQTRADGEIFVYGIIAFHFVFSVINCISSMVVIQKGL